MEGPGLGCRTHLGNLALGGSQGLADRLASGLEEGSRVCCYGTCGKKPGEEQGLNAWHINTGEDSQLGVRRIKAGRRR